jgi:hypothetical protein
VVILQDTRESKPLRFKIDTILTEVRREKLQIGDYQALYTDGKLSQVVFERKAIPDLFGTMGKGYTRFRKRLIEANDRGVHLILLIEGSIGDVLAGHKHSYRDGGEVVQQIFTLWIRHRLMPVFAADKQEASRYVVETFMAIGRERHRMNDNHAKD